MNEFRLIGEVSNVKPYNFPSGAAKVTFTLKAYVTQKKMTYLNCESWNKSFVENMVDGMLIELTNYIPQTQSYQDRTGAKVYRQVIVVQNFALIQENSFSEIKETPKQVANVPKQEFNTKIEDILEPIEKWDWMSELDKIPSNQPSSEQVEALSKPSMNVSENLEMLQKQIENNGTQFSYEQLLEINKPYQHGLVEKPPIIAGPDGKVEVDEKVKRFLNE